MESRNQEHKAYVVENLLVITMVGSAILLQMRRARLGKNERGPLLLRLLDEVPSVLIPWPLDVLLGLDD